MFKTNCSGGAVLSGSIGLCSVSDSSKALSDGVLQAVSPFFSLSGLIGSLQFLSDGVLQAIAPNKLVSFEAAAAPPAQAAASLS